MENTPDLSIIIVNYHTEEFLRGCLASVTASVESVSPEIFVVDNGSTHDKIEALKRQFPQVNWMSPECNAGFSAANNLAAGSAQGRYILLLNPDVETPPGALDWFVRLADANPDVGVAGCTLVYPDGIVQQGIEDGAPITEQSAGSHGRTVIDRGDLLGACMLIRRDAWEQCGPMDERFFLFHEDMEYCHRARAFGWRVCLFPDIRVTHHGGSSYSEHNYTSVARQKALSHLLYCRDCLPIGQGLWEISAFALNALWCSLYYSVKSLNGRQGTIHKKQRHIGRLQALILLCLKRNRTL